MMIIINNFKAKKLYKIKIATFGEKSVKDS